MIAAPTPEQIPGIIREWLERNPHLAGIFPGVRNCLMQVLRLEEEEVLPQSKLDHDFGLESIDVPDLVLGLERTFKITVSEEEFFPSDVYANADYVRQNGSQGPELSLTGYEELQCRQPFRSFARFKRYPTIAELRFGFTVEDLCQYVLMKQRQK